ncbi:MAG: D-inositol-3-phosphate glycosyltransferase, partial [Verrucomicrobiota bacterium]
MHRVLVLTTDLPYFPGRNGHDFFNLRHLARSSHVGLVAPRYPHVSDASVKNLVESIQSHYLWPDEAKPIYLHCADNVNDNLRPIFRKLPKVFLKSLLKYALKIHREPSDALEKISILRNCAPNLLEALHTLRWDAVVLIQSSLAPWLEYLPSGPAKIVYFHDVRSDYLNRSRNIPGYKKPSRANVCAIKNQEATAIRRSDMAGFVS